MTDGEAAAVGDQLSRLEHHVGGDTPVQGDQHGGTDDGRPHSVTKDKEPLSLEIHGRHDPVIVPRAVVVVESMAAITLADALFVNMSSQMDKVRDFYRK